MQASMHCHSSRTTLPSRHATTPCTCGQRAPSRPRAGGAGANGGRPAEGAAANGRTRSSGAGTASATASRSSSSTSSSSSTTSSTSTSSSSTSSTSSGRKTAVVIGGGFAGFGAALALAKAGAEVTLIDAADNPGGLSSAFTTPGGQVVEPGIKGCWYQYANIEALVKELGVSPFTPYTSSSFWTPEGLQVESPIFQDLPRVPAPLGTFVHTATLFRGLSLPDRASALPLLKPLLEHDLDEELYRHYDSMSAYELFASNGVTKRLYDNFLSPMLLVTLFAPATQLSAAAALGALYYFALAHQPDFDVRWFRGPIGTLVFEPLVLKLQAMGVRVLGGRRVQEILPATEQQQQLQQQQGRRGAPLAGRVVVSGKGQQQGGTGGGSGGGSAREVFDADVVVVAAGVTALQQLVQRSQLLGSAPDLAASMGLDCSDVMAVRLWLDSKVALRTPSNVVAGFDEGVGGTLFQLDELQDAYKSDTASVLEFDLYHAGPLLPLSDDAIVQRLLNTYLAPALPGGAAAAAALRVQDASVLRFRKAVTRFSPGSHDQLPGIATSIPNLYVAGDCVKQGPGTHGCKGLSQEKAYVTGLQAGNAAATWLGLQPVARVLPVEPDEPQVAAAKDLLRTQRQLQQLVLGGLSGAVSSLKGGSNTSRPAGRSGGSGGGGGAAGVTAVGASQAGGGPARSSGGMSVGAELLREDEQLQELLRNEVVEQLGASSGAAANQQQQ